MTNKNEQLLFDKINQLSKTTLAITVTASILLIAFIDWITGLHVHIDVFYFIPIFLASIKFKRMTVYFTAFACTALLYAVSIIGGHHFKGMWNEIWNNGVRLLSYLSIAFASVTIKTHLDFERALSDELGIQLSEVKQLKKLLPICAYCKKIRDGNGEWQQQERYISTRTHTQFSHGACPECFDRAMKSYGLDPQGIKPESLP